MFLLNAGRHNLVEIHGTISRLLSIKNRHADGVDIQLPQIREVDVNKTVVLKQGQSTFFPIGDYQVRVARSL